MSILAAWRPLSNRIHSLNEAAKLDAALHLGNAARTRATPFLASQCQEIFNELEKFKTSFQSSLPQEALGVLEKAPSLCGDLHPPSGDSADSINRGITANSLVHLQAIESVITFSLSGLEEQILSTTERALQHLQRSLIVDGTLRERWIAAFDKREDSVEALGAVHLLGHGIFAFKVNAKGARTDLVLPDVDVREATRYSSGIVLTEWKLAEAQSESEKKFREARTQAARYAIGLLSGIELRLTRYAIVVTKKEVQCPADDVDQNGVTYRNVNIVLSPEVPSKAARS
jgi:hypothetical protein